MKQLKQKVILFDLDGTLTDSAAGVIASVRHCLAGLHQEPSANDDLLFLVGPPLWESFTGYFGLSEQDAAKALKTYRRHYEEEGMFLTKIFPGIQEMLGELLSKEKRLGVATSKSQDFAEKILTHYGLLHYFDFVAGSDNGNLDLRNTKAKVLRYALENMQADVSEAVLVGDRMYDIIGAKEIGMPVVAVEYGYGTRAELVSYGADYIVKTPADVAALFDEEEA